MSVIKHFMGESVKKVEIDGILRNNWSPAASRPWFRRLNEMHERGLVFKPDPSRPEWRLTTNGKKWIEENVMVKLRKKEVMP